MNHHIEESIFWGVVGAVMIFFFFWVLVSSA